MALCERQKHTVVYERDRISSWIQNSYRQISYKFNWAIAGLTEKQCKETGEHRWKCQNKDGRTMGEKMQHCKEITFLVKMFMFYEQITLKRHMTFYKWQLVKWKMQQLITE